MAFACLCIHVNFLHDRRRGASEATHLAGLLLVNEQAWGGEGSPEEGAAVRPSPIPGPHPCPPPTYLLMREAKGCTCREVPMTRSRSTFWKSYEGGREGVVVRPGEQGG